MKTDYLFPKQSFFRGIASLGNLSGSLLSNSSKSIVEADGTAINADWNMVGEDIREAINHYAG